MLNQSLAPGSRVRIRDEEWMVEKCLPLPTGGYAVHVRGLSELVLSRPAIFLDTLDTVLPLREAKLHNLGRKRSGVDQLFTWTLIKAFLSSPHACLESIDNRIKTTSVALKPDERGKHPYAGVLQQDIKRLAELRSLVEAASAPASFTKLETLFAQLKTIGITGKKTRPGSSFFPNAFAPWRCSRLSSPRASSSKTPSKPSAPLKRLCPIPSCAN
jgi:hypothetical protein